MSDMPPTATPDDSSQVMVEVLTKLEEKTETTESDSAPAIVPVKLQKVQLNSENEFYQGEVIPDTNIKHGVGVLLDKKKMTKYQGAFEFNKKNGDGQLEFLDEVAVAQEYMGGFKDDIYEGMGILYYRDGEIYKGEFVDGQPTEGMIIYTDGSEYCGAVKGDARDGYGILKYANEDTYSGDFVDNKRQGKGLMMINSTGISINGVFVDDEIKMGHRKHFDETYFGEFNQQYQFHGKGVYSYKNGEIYQGNFENGLQSGWGTFKDATSIYEGKWVEGKKEQGTLKNEEGDIYCGSFTEDGLKDCGVLQFNNGDEFSGHFENGFREMGQMIYKSTGSFYKGTFVDGLPHGSGELITIEGDVYKGEFQFGLKHGEGQLELHDNGGTYIGEFSKDMMHGNGCFKMPDGSEFVGEFREGVQHGDGMMILSNGTEIFGRWEDGKYLKIEYNLTVGDNQEVAVTGEAYQAVNGDADDQL